VEAMFEQIMRQLDGIGRLLMSIDANLKEVVRLLQDEDDEEEADT
jgi:hypothetical protein